MKLEARNRVETGSSEGIESKMRNSERRREEWRENRVEKWKCKEMRGEGNKIYEE